MSTNEFRTIALADLLPHPHNPRTDLGDPQKLSELANDLAANGNKTALRVFPIAEGEDQGKFLIIEGHRRRAAAELGNVAELFCEIDPTLDTLPKQLESMLRENTHREPISAINEAAAIQTMMEFDGYGSVAKVAKVAKAINRSPATVRKRLLLNKLNDEAKTRIEDNTLNIDQAIVLVDFADNEDATQRLLAAAAESPRQFAYQVEYQTRLRDVPGKIAALEAELNEAGAKFLPATELYSGRYNRIYENDTNELSTAEHVAAEHLAFIDSNWGKLDWWEKPAKASKATVELTDEEKEAKRRDAALTAALDIAHAVRAEHIKSVIKSPPEGAAEEALYRLLLRNLTSRISLFAEITGRAPNQDDDHFAIKAALQDMTAEQMALLLHMSERSQEDELLKLWAWDAGDYRHTWGPKGWIEDLGSVYHYELSAVEQEVLDHFKQAHDARLAEIASEDQEEDDADDE